MSVRKSVLPDRPKESRVSSKHWSRTLMIFSEKMDEVAERSE